MGRDWLRNVRGDRDPRDRVQGGPQDRIPVPVTDTVRDTAQDGPGGTGVRVEQVPFDPDDDAELVEGVLVDLPAGAVAGMYPWERPAQRRDAIPLWLRDTRTRREAIRWGADLAKHKAKYHGTRIPLYTAKLAYRAPRGLARVTGEWARWLRDAETAPLRADAIRRADAAEHMRLATKTADRIKARAWLSAIGGVTGLAVVGTVLFAAPAPIAWALALAAVLWLGAKGGSADDPLIGRAVVTGEVPVLTSDLVVQALGALGIAEMNKAIKAGTGIGFPSPIMRDGPGFRCDVDLPLGVTATDIMERRSALASALRRPLGCVWPEQDPDHHEGRLMLWVGDRDMAKAPPAAWPLARTGKSNLFEPIPFGTDQRGRVVFLLLMFANMLIGAMPRSGKMFALRILLLAAA